MKRLLLIAAAAAAVFISGCGNDKALLKAQADVATAQSNARVEEAKAEQERARAVIAVSSKLDAGGAAAYVLGITIGKNIGSAPQLVQQQVQRPRDWLDYITGTAQAFSSVATALTPLGLGIVNAQTTRASYQRDVSLEQARQGGESSRIQSVGSIAIEVARNQPQANITNNTTTLSGTGVIGSGTYTGPVTTTTTTHTCPGGTSTAGNGTTTGGTSGSAQGGTC